MISSIFITARHCSSLQQTLAADAAVLGEALEVFRLPLDFSQFDHDGFVDLLVEVGGEDAAAEVAHQPGPAVAGTGPLALGGILDGQGNGEGGVEGQSSRGSEGTGNVVENGNAQIPSEFVLNESSVGVAQQQQEEDENKDAHGFVRNNLPYVATLLQNQLRLHVPPQELAEEEASEGSQHLGQPVERQPFPPVLVLLLDAVGQSDHGVEVGSAEGRHDEDSEQNRAGGLHLDLFGIDGAAEEKGEEEDCQELVGEYLGQGGLVHDAVLFMGEVAEHAFLEGLGHLEFFLEFAAEEGLVDLRPLCHD